MSTFFTVIRNSFKHHPITQLGRWNTLNNETQKHNKAIRSSVDHCGSCSINIIDLEYIFDEKDLEEAKKQIPIPDTGPYRCKHCGSMYHTTRECPNKINSKF